MSDNYAEITNIDLLLGLLKKHGVQAAKVGEIEVSFFPTFKEVPLTFSEPELPEEEKLSLIKEKQESDLYYSAR